ncbi:MAG: HI1506-related protein [Syntrophobacteraceae bacterium]
MLRIRSTIAGFRRCGISHPAEWVEHPDGVFTAEQIEQLKAEPMLQVEGAGGQATGELVQKLLDKIQTLEGLLATATGLSATLSDEKLDLQNEVRRLSERVSQLELTRDSLQDEVNILTTDKKDLETEIEGLKANVPPGPAGFPRPKNKREVA